MWLAAHSETDLHLPVIASRRHRLIAVPDVVGDGHRLATLSRDGWIMVRRIIPAVLTASLEVLKNAPEFGAFTGFNGPDPFQRANDEANSDLLLLIADNRRWTPPPPPVNRGPIIDLGIPFSDTSC